MHDIRLNHLQKQQEVGIDFIVVNDCSYYYHVLDTATMFGIVPKRFQYKGGIVPLSVYYSMARGTVDAPASEMTKWFNTNYHYIVPELNEATPTLTENKPLLAYREAKEKLGIDGKPVILGPLTFLKLSKGYDKTEFDDILRQLLPLYVKILHELKNEGVSWVQIDEPILVTKISAADVHRLQAIYKLFASSVPNLNIMLQTYFESVEHCREIITLPVKGIGLDFVHGYVGNLTSIQTVGFPEDKILGAGVIDGRGIWKAPLQEKLDILDVLTKHVTPDRLIVQSSCSLLHVPVTTKQEAEAELELELKHALTFADEKLEELAFLTNAFSENRGALTKTLNEHERISETFRLFRNGNHSNTS